MSKAKKLIEIDEATPVEEIEGVDWKIGDVVAFTGKTCYSGSGEKRGLGCKGGLAAITGIAPDGKHPYHLIRVPGHGATVYGWVDAEYIATPLKDEPLTYHHIP